VRPAAASCALAFNAFMSAIETYGGGPFKVPADRQFIINIDRFTGARQLDGALAWRKNVDR
jgi:hypothetical protein